jgi:exopolyphosphatase/guanosine-5'-triphosphate,3'-diphosphate pyrophosphatase
MEPIRRAVIDVGTNSVKLLVADVARLAIQPVREESRQTRLGQGFYQTRRLQPPAVAASAAAVAEFAAVARQCGASSIRVVATSAAREAVNAQDLLEAVRAAAGLPVEILAGEQEADWVFRGVTTDAALAEHPLLLLDVGGGSTEFVVGLGGQKLFEKSFPIGTVRLLEQRAPPDPPRPEDLALCRRWLKEFLETNARPVLAPVLESAARQWAAPTPFLLVGTGGTASILACMEARLETFDRERIEAARLSLARLRALTEQLWSLPLEQRKQLVGLPKNRADVILMGAAIYEAIMEQFAFSELRISTRGLRFAALLDQVDESDRPQRPLV